MKPGYVDHVVDAAESDPKFKESVAMMEQLIVEACPKRAGVVNVHLRDLLRCAILTGARAAIGEHLDSMDNV